MLRSNNKDLVAKLKVSGFKGYDTLLNLKKKRSLIQQFSKTHSSFQSLKEAKPSVDPQRAVTIVEQDKELADDVEQTLG